MRTPRPPTLRQRKVLSFILAFFKEHGKPPTTRKIAHRFGWTSENSSRAHIKALVHKGLVKKGEFGKLQLPEGSTRNLPITKPSTSLKNG